MDAPACYVVPLDESAGDNESMNGLWQEVEERIGVIVQFSTDDRRGQGAAEEFDTMKAAVKSAVLNWRPDVDRSSKGFRYAGGQLRDDFDRARLFYQWEFIIETLTTEEDGWQQPNVALTEIDFAGHNPDTLTQTVDLRVPLPQD